MEGKGWRQSGKAERLCQGVWSPGWAAGRHRGCTIPERESPVLALSHLPT